MDGCSASSSGRDSQNVILLQGYNEGDYTGEGESDDDFGGDFHYGKSFLAKLKGHLAETMTSSSYAMNISDDAAPPSAVETSDTSSSGSDCELSLEERRTTRVQFSSVSIRTYAVTVGDTCVAKAYPLTLDWAHTPTETLDIDLFEEIFASAQTKPRRKMIRGFRLPAQLRSGQRFDRLTAVTGRAPEDLYELDFARIVRENEIPNGACSSDEGYEEDPCRRAPYEVVDVDDYELVEF